MKTATLICMILLVAAPAAGFAEDKPYPESGSITKQPPALKEPVELESWRKTILKTPRPKKGCFTAAYPEKQWREVACETPPHKLYLPKHSGMIGPEIVGGDGPNEFSASWTGNVSWVEGSFLPGTVLSSECNVPCPNEVCPSNPTCSLPSANPNLYSLQLNTKPFITKACNNSPNNSPDPGGCRGWEQFIYDSSTGTAFIQYWLKNYGPAGTSCPSPISSKCQGGVQSDGWCPFSYPNSSEVNCVINAVYASSKLPPEPITSLTELIVTGAVAGALGHEEDSVSVSVANTFCLLPRRPSCGIYLADGNNYFPDLATQWKEAEFNVFGDGDAAQAYFSNGSTIVVKIEVDDGTTNAPSCSQEGFAHETNSLNLVPPCCSVSGATVGSTPAILFTESNVAGTQSMCACPSGTTWNVSVGSCACNDPSQLYVNGQCVSTTCPPGDGWVWDASGFSCRPIPPCPATCPHCIVDNVTPGAPKFICPPAKAANP